MNKPILLTLQRPRGDVFLRLSKIPQIQILYFGAMACSRHRSHELVQLQKQKKLSYLCFSEVDVITGHYLERIEQAVTEIVEERNPFGLVLLTGCQCSLMGTDYQLLTGSLEKKLQVPIRINASRRLWGFDLDDTISDTGTVEEILYDFLKPDERSAQCSVNIIGTTQMDPQNELYRLLKDAGVQKINEISRCNTVEEYQEMAKAHLNIICMSRGERIGNSLEEKLGIPWVTFEGIYQPDQIEQQYKYIGEKLNYELNTERYKNRIKTKTRQIAQRLTLNQIIVEGELSLAKWLYLEKMPVSEVRISSRSDINTDEMKWFEQNAPGISVNRIGRGRRRPAENATSQTSTQEETANQSGMRSRGDDRPNGIDARSSEAEITSKSRESQGARQTAYKSVGYRACERALTILEESIRREAI